MRTVSPDLRTVPVTKYRAPSSLQMTLESVITLAATTVDGWRYANDELRAITYSQDDLLSLVMMSSAKPSEKYSCSGSLLKLAKGSTAIERVATELGSATTAGTAVTELSVGSNTGCTKRQMHVPPKLLLAHPTAVAVRAYAIRNWKRLIHSLKRAYLL